MSVSNLRSARTERLLKGKGRPYRRLKESYGAAASIRRSTQPITRPSGRKESSRPRGLGIRGIEAEPSARGAAPAL